MSNSGNLKIKNGNQFTQYVQLLLETQGMKERAFLEFI